MMNRSFYEEAAKAYNLQYDTRISVVMSERGKLAPEIELESQEVRFNPHFLTFITLFNIANDHRSAGCAAIHHFLLYHLALNKNMYDKADELLHLLDNDIDQLLCRVNQTELRIYALVSEYQRLFILLHEFSHIYYHHHPEALAANSIILKDDLIALRKQLDTASIPLARLLHFFIPKMKKLQERSFDEAISSLPLQEELLCDEAAWRMAKHVIHQGLPDEETRAMMSAQVVYTLYYVEAQRTLENIYMSDDNAHRQKHLMFDTTRSTVLVNNVWGDVEAKAIECYKPLINKVARQVRISLMLSLRTNIDHMGYIRLMPKEKFSLQENKRLNANYKEIEGKLMNEIATGETM